MKRRKVRTRAVQHKERKLLSVGDQRAAFLESLSATGNITRACEISGTPRQTAYDWRKSDTEFAALWDRARELGIEALEDEANRRAREGVERPVYQAGKLVGYVQEYSDTLLIFLLKGAKPDKYRDRQQVDLNATIRQSITDFADVELAAIAAAGAGGARGNQGTGEAGGGAD